jgi:hypothetical protein
MYMALEVLQYPVCKLYRYMYCIQCKYIAHAVNMLKIKSQNVNIILRVLRGQFAHMYASCFASIFTHTYRSIHAIKSWFLEERALVKNPTLLEKPAVTQTSIWLASHLVRASNSGGHEFESPMRRELCALTKKVERLL